MKEKANIRMLFSVLLLVSLLSLVTFSAIVCANDENSKEPPQGYEGNANSVNVLQLRGTQGKDKLIIMDVNPWTLTSLQDALSYLGYSYDIVGSSDLPNVNLKDYKVVIIASDQPDSFYDNMVANKMLLEEYVSGGGILVAHMCDMGWSGGFWEEPFLPCAPNLSHETEYMENLSIVDPTHPIISGPHGTLTNDNIDNWHYSSHGYFTNLPANAKILIGAADNPTGKPVYVWWTCGRGAVFATMMTVEWAYYRDYNKMLLLNEITHAQTFKPLPVGGIIVSSIEEPTKTRLTSYILQGLIAAVTTLTTATTILLAIKRRHKVGKS